jgi:hypothetical protein
MIVAGSWPDDLFDTNTSDGSPTGRAIVTTERDGNFLLPLQTAIQSSADPIESTNFAAK